MCRMRPRLFGSIHSPGDDSSTASNSKTHADAGEPRFPAARYKATLASPTRLSIGPPRRTDPRLSGLAMFENGQLFKDSQDTADIRHMRRFRSSDRRVVERIVFCSLPIAPFGQAAHSQHIHRRFWPIRNILSLLGALGRWHAVRR